MSTQVQNKPTAAYILSLLGGILGLLFSIALFAWGAFAYSAYNDWINEWSGYYGGYYDYSGDLFGLGWSFMIGFGIWALIASILVIIFARKLNANPMEHSKWGALILVFSILGGGTILGFIGGILALVYKPIPYGGQQAYQPQYAAPPGYIPPPTYAQPTQQPVTRICPQCGRVINENTKFCPYCGKQLA